MVWDFPKLVGAVWDGRNLGSLTWVYVSCFWLGKVFGNVSGNYVFEDVAMTFNPKLLATIQGFELAAKIDRDHARTTDNPVPTRWGCELGGYGNIGELVTAIRRFDTEADQVIRVLSNTPIGDSDATLTLVAGLIPGLVHKHSTSTYEIADVLVETCLYVAERHGLNAQQPAWTTILDEATRRARRTYRSQESYDSATVQIDTGMRQTGYADVAETAIARVQFEHLRDAVEGSDTSVSLDNLVALADEKSLDPKARKQLSRNRRKIRGLVDQQLREVA